MANHDSTSTPGQMLRDARQRLDRSLQQAHEGTKIPVRLIEAIERDEYHKLSGPIYVKSFLRNYAGWLGLDAERVLSVYELAAGRPDPGPTVSDQVWSEDKVAVTRVGMPWKRLVAVGVAAAVVLIALVILALRLFSGGDERSAAELERPTEAVSQAQSTEVAGGRESAAAGAAATDPDQDDLEGGAVPVQESAAGDGSTADPAADRPAADVDREAAATPPEPASEITPPEVAAKTQPRDHPETRQQRIARLDEYRFGGPPEPEPEKAPQQEREPELEPAGRESQAGAAVADAATADAATGAEPEPASREPESRVELPVPRRGDPDLRFLGGESYPLVLRVLMPEPANCRVRRDDQADAVPVIWPDQPMPPPAYNLRHGVAYAVRGGFAIYWGAEDHFTLTLDRIRGVEVSLNGNRQPLGDWRPGQTKLLDRSSLPDGG